MGKKIAPEDRPLTEKQKAWLEWYCQNGWNATEAAKQAGYKGNRAQLSVIGSENLVKPNIRKKLSDRFAKLGMSADETIARLVKMARSFDVMAYTELRETYRFNKRGKKILHGYVLWVDIDKLRKDGVGHLVKKIKQTKSGIEIEWHDTMRALELIGKHHALFTDRVELEATFTIQEALEKSSDEELDEFIEECREATEDS